MNTVESIESQQRDAEQHYAALQPYTDAQWATIQEVNTSFTVFDNNVLIHAVPHCEAQAEARALLKAAHAKVIEAVIENWPDADDPDGEDANDVDADADSPDTAVSD